MRVAVDSHRPLEQVEATAEAERLHQPDQIAAAQPGAAARHGAQLNGRYTTRRQPRRHPHLGRLPLAVDQSLEQRADEHAEAAEEGLQPGVGGLQRGGLCAMHRVV